MNTMAGRGVKPAMRGSTLAVIVMGALGACATDNAAHKAALGDAQAAIRRGDTVGAARAYRAACRAQPSDRTSCEAAANWSRRAVSERLALARPLCEPPDGKVDPQQCLRALAPARELEAARSEARETPAMLEEPIKEEFHYVARRHEWTVRWIADVTLAGQTVRASGAAAATDEEHEGNARAGLGADPLSPPEGPWFLADVSSQLAARAADLASGELARRATERRAACVGDAPVWTGPWLQCWAEATLWSGVEPAGLPLLVGTAHAQDRVRPNPGWPAPSCL
jgi:hypothetical protein